MLKRDFWWWVFNSVDSKLLLRVRVNSYVLPFKRFLFLFSNFPYIFISCLLKLAVWFLGGPNLGAFSVSNIINCTAPRNGGLWITETSETLKEGVQHKDGWICRLLIKMVNGEKRFTKAINLHAFWVICIKVPKKRGLGRKTVPLDACLPIATFGVCLQLFRCRNERPQSPFCLREHNKF